MKKITPSHAEPTSLNLTEEVADDRSQMVAGWPLGYDGWKDMMDHNIMRIGLFGFHLSAKDRDVTDPSALTPADGDTYIVAASATKDWSGHDDDVAVWDEYGSQWLFATPSEGWICYVADEQKLAAYDGSQWSNGVSL